MGERERAVGGRCGGGGPREARGAAWWVHVLRAHGATAVGRVERATGWRTERTRRQAAERVA
eukprot:COSAG02_NODE_3611_length_6484_cov_172.449178_5_plen_62_part_00